jgi:hypothetical protein
MFLKKWSQMSCWDVMLDGKVKINAQYVILIYSVIAKHSPINVGY